MTFYLITEGETEMQIDAHGVSVIRCDKCEAPTDNPENDYAEHVCDDCEQNAAEAAYERYCEDFHDGGATRFRSLQEQQIEAMKLK